MSNALSQKSDLEQIADQLTQSADAMNEGVKIGISNNTCTQEKAYAIMHDEQTLRSHANAIYMNAARCVVSGLTLEQDDLLKTIQKANDTLRKMGEFNKFLSITASMLAIASAISAAQPSVIFATVNALKSEIGM
jgi:hypothetical protein